MDSKYRPGGMTWKKTSPEPSVLSALNDSYDRKAIIDSRVLCNRLGSRAKAMDFLGTETGGDDYGMFRL